MPQGPFRSTIGQNTALQWAAAKFGQLGNLLVTQGAPPYNNLVQGKQAFHGANQGGATLSNGLATTYVGLCLSNPAGSGVDLLVTRVQGLTFVAPAAFLALGLIEGFAAGGITVHTTALTPTCSLIGDTTTPKAKLDAACTLVGTPAWARWFNSEAATAQNPMFSEYMNGSMIIPQGGYLAIGGSAAGPSSGFLGSFEWIEVTH